MMLQKPIRLRQAGMVLLISLVVLLLLSLIGLSSMQGAVSQQKVTASLWHRNQSLQSAEWLAAWGVGGAAVICDAAAVPVDCHLCTAGRRLFGGWGWGGPCVGHYLDCTGRRSIRRSSPGGAVGLAHLPPQTVADVYRVTAVGLSGQLRTVLESVYAHVEEEGGSRFRRVAWRQLQ